MNPTPGKALSRAVYNVMRCAVETLIKAINNNLPDIEYKLDEPMKAHTTFNIGGPVSIMFFPDSISSAAKLCTIISEFKITPLIIGNGSNILTTDNELKIVVINTSKLCKIELLDQNKENTQNHVNMQSCEIPSLKSDENNDITFSKNCYITESPEIFEIEAEAGVLLSRLAVFAYKNSLTGLEFAHGIPGTVGGAIVMNAGAYDGEMKDIVHSTTAYNIKSGIYISTAEEHEFSYRHSRFSNSTDVVLSTVIRLHKGNKSDIKQKMDDFNMRRRKSQPLDLPSGGSTFKRPREGYAAALIEQAGLKGFTIGGAQVSEKHAGFVVNQGDATFSDTIAVIDHVRDTVLNKCGSTLELEVKVIC